MSDATEINCPSSPTLNVRKLVENYVKSTTEKKSQLKSHESQQARKVRELDLREHREDKELINAIKSAPI